MKLLMKTTHMKKKGKEHEELKSLGRIIPKVVPDQTLRNMRHERICHMLKGVIAKCDIINLERCQKLGQKIKSTTSSNFSKFEKRLSAIKIPNGKFSLEI